MARRQYQTKPDTLPDLTPEQQNALGLLLAGETDEATAQAVGVTRQTVWEWRNRHPLFCAELNRQRESIWAAQADRLRGMIGRAVDVLAGDLDSDDPKIKREAAIHILKCVGIYGASMAPSGDTNPGLIRKKHMLDDLW